MSQLTSKEVREMASVLLHNPKPREWKTQVGKMLTAFANRIEADERAVPVAWEYRNRDLEEGWGTWKRCTEDDFKLLSGSHYTGIIETRALCSYPPVQSVWLDAQGIPHGEVSDEQIIAVLGNAIAICEKRSGLAEPAAQVDLCEDEGCPQHSSEHVCIAPTADPVAQGEVTECVEDNSGLCRRAAGNLSMMLSLARDQLHADEATAVQKIIDELRATQTHSPDAADSGRVDDSELRKVVEIAQGDLHMLKMAIEARDPWSELLIRVTDTERDLRAALAAQGQSEQSSNDHRARAITERDRFEHALKAIAPNIYEKLRGAAPSATTEGREP